MVRKGSPVRVRQRASQQPSGNSVPAGRCQRRPFALRGPFGTISDPFAALDGRARVRDQLVGVHGAGAAELVDDVCVGPERHRRAVAELLGDLHDRQPPLLDPQARQRVPQVVRPRAQAARLGVRLERAPTPVAVVVVAPRLATRRREDERVVCGPTSAQPQLLEVLAQRGEQLDRARRSVGLLAGDDLAVDVLLLDQQCPLPDVPPLERERFLRPDPGVREHADERGMFVAPFGEQLRAQRLDAQRRHGAHRVLALARRLAHRLDRVGCDELPLDRPGEHALEHRQRATDRLVADVVGFEVGAEARDDLRRDPPQLERAEARQDVAVPVRRVRRQRPPLEVRRRVDLPPLGREVGERLFPGVEGGQVVRASRDAHLRIEVPRVALAVERPAALRARLVPPADPVDGVRRSVTAAALAALDHDVLPIPAATVSRPSAALRRPERAAAVGRVGDAEGAGAGEAEVGAATPLHASIHLSISSGFTRYAPPLPSRHAFSAPLRIAR
jgi:hypothetical protein